MKSNKKKIRVRSVMVVAAVILGIFPGLVFAHSPSEVTLNYNKETKALEVKITHSVSSPSSHYVKKVEIRKNGETVIAPEYQSQPDKKTFTYTYEIDLAPGDQLEVKASCSVFGSETARWKAE